MDFFLLYLILRTLFHNLRNIVIILIILYNTNYIVCRYNKNWLVFGSLFYNNFLLLFVLFTVTFHVEKKQILYNVSMDMIPRTSQPISFT